MIRWDKRQVDLRQKKEKVYCASCGVERKYEDEGRVIDGNYWMDKMLSEKYLGKWVCSHVCYGRLVHLSGEEKKKGGGGR
jgi:hypothetical protein